MNKKNVLIVSNKLGEKNSLEQWIENPHPFHLHIVNSEESAIEVCQQYFFDVAVIDTTDTEINARKLHAVLPILQESLALLPYEGETSGELNEDIEAVFNAQKYKRIQKMLMLEPSVSAFSNLPSFSLN